MKTFEEFTDKKIQLDEGLFENIMKDIADISKDLAKIADQNVRNMSPDKTDVIIAKINHLDKLNQSIISLRSGK